MVMKTFFTLATLLFVGLVTLQANAQSTAPNVTVLPVEKQVQAIGKATEKKPMTKDAKADAVKKDAKKMKDAMPAKK